jgi:hypothetical protein
VYFPLIISMVVGVTSVAAETVHVKYYSPLDLVSFVLHLSYSELHRSCLP